jgi:hypothetical protein
VPTLSSNELFSFDSAAKSVEVGIPLDAVAIDLLHLPATSQLLVLHDLPDEVTFYKVPEGKQRVVRRLFGD